MLHLLALFASILATNVSVSRGQGFAIDCFVATANFTVQRWLGLYCLKLCFYLEDERG